MIVLGGEMAKTMERETWKSVNYFIKFIVHIIIILLGSSFYIIRSHEPRFTKTGHHDAGA